MYAWVSIESGNPFVGLPDKWDIKQLTAIALTCEVDDVMVIKGKDEKRWKKKAVIGTFEAVSQSTKTESQSPRAEPQGMTTGEASDKK